jgi:uncharacterized membrane protein required for colicin V production
MHQQSPQPSGMAGIIYGLGNALGIIAAFFLAPPLFRLCSPYALDYLIEYWGYGIAKIVIAIIGLCSAYITFAMISLVFNFTMTSLVASFAARRLSNGPKARKQP